MKRNKNIFLSRTCSKTGARAHARRHASGITTAVAGYLAASPLISPLFAGALGIYITNVPRQIRHFPSNMRVNSSLNWSVIVPSF